MTDILQKPPQAKTQDAPLHRAAPPAANQTNMRARGMMPPQHFAKGGFVPDPVSSANRFAPANEQAAAPADQTPAPFNPTPGAAAYGRGVDLLNNLVTPAAGPPVDMAARFRAPAAAPVQTITRNGTRLSTSPLSAAPTQPEASAALSAAVGAHAPGLAGPQHGTVDHAAENAHQYSLPEFLKATEGMSNQQFYKMMGLTHQRTMQEQAGGLALQMALHGDTSSPQFMLTRGLASGPFASPYLGMGGYNSNAGSGM